MKTTKMWCGVAAAAITAAVLAGCSSSGGSDGSAEDGASTPGASNPAIGDQTGGAVTAAVTAALRKVTALPVTEPLASKPPTGKTVIYVQCEVAQCALQGKGIEAAAKALGWNYRVLNFQASNPATLVTTLKDALRFKPLAVYFSGVPYDLWKSVIPDYRKAGAYIVPSSVPDTPTDDVVITSLAANAYYEQGGRLIADLATQKSGGKAKILFATVPSYTIFKPLEQGYTAELTSVCPACTTRTFDATLPQVTGNQMVPAIVSELKRNPDIDYVLTSNGDFLQTLPQALQTAGIDPGRITIITFSGTSAIQQLVQKAQIYSTTGWGYGYEGWLGVDAALRVSEGMRLSPSHESLPLQLLTKDNIGTPSDSIDVPADYQSQFEKLWLLDS